MLLTIANDKKVFNESQWPRTYTSKFLQAGLVDYSDMGLGILNLPKETIDQHLINSFVDKPVVVKHKDVNTGNFVDLAVGFIKSVYYNSVDGWYYCDFMIHRDEGHEKIKNGWGVSCAYKVGQLGQGGTKNNIVYNGNIVTGEGEHLALVQNPRYEECRVIINGKAGVIYNEKDFLLRNTKQEDNKMFFNFFGKKEDKGFSGDTLVDIGNGKKAKLADIIALNNSLSDKHEIDGKHEIELANGKKLTLEEAVANYAKSLQNKSTDENEKEDEDKDNKKDEGADKDKKAENAKKLANCGCGGKDGHKADCTMYNEDGSDKKDEKKEKEEKMENELKALKLENEALKAAQKGMESFVKIENARNQNQEDVTLENSTKNSGTIENKLENSKKFFTVKK
jgi:hypothetical protein